MRPKPPSSLDYDDFLHELALKNWNRAMLGGDGERAEANAKKLAASHDKFWRFVGHIHLSTSRLTRGQATLAVDALAEAARVFTEPSEIAAIPKCLRAHIHLETHSPKSALSALQDAVATPEVTYWRALARAREGRHDEALELAAALEVEAKPASNAYALHIRAELDPQSRLASLQRAASTLEKHGLLSPLPILPIRFAHASALEEAGSTADAEARFREITGASESLAYWPIPYIRSLYHLGRLGSDEEERQRSMKSFAAFWTGGEMDRAAVQSACQFQSHSPSVNK
ncbi:MAG: hypothetical protein E2P02_28610 [Acidobacteria bacterium]|nr:MAG: hypothetical protein E2P02_28610 [Acidobacteriota bacterium]